MGSLNCGSWWAVRKVSVPLHLKTECLVNAEMLGLHAMMPQAGWVHKRCSMIRFLEIAEYVRRAGGPHTTKLTAENVARVDAGCCDFCLDCAGQKLTPSRLTDKLHISESPESTPCSLLVKQEVPVKLRKLEPDWHAAGPSKPAHYACSTQQPS